MVRNRRREVRDAYDRIASHFAKTRPEAWSEIPAFLEGRRARLGVDVGVGNGRHAEHLAGHADRVVGVDISRAALDAAADRARERSFDDALDLVQADAATLPLRDGSAGLAVYVATLHHLPSRGLRRRSLDELARVLEPGGAALVGVWSTEHDRFDRETGFDTTVDWTLPDGERVARYYHIYDPEEFHDDLVACALAPVETFVSAGNCYAVVTPEQ